LWLWILVFFLGFLALGALAQRRRFDEEQALERRRRHRLCDASSVEYTGEVRRGVYSLRCSECAQAFWTDLPPPPSVSLRAIEPEPLEEGFEFDEPDESEDRRR